MDKLPAEAVSENGVSLPVRPASRQPSKRGASHGPGAEAGKEHYAPEAPRPLSRALTSSSSRPSSSLYGDQPPGYALTDPTQSNLEALGVDAAPRGRTSLCPCD